MNDKEKTMKKTLSITTALMLTALVTSPMPARAAGMGDSGAMPMGHGMKNGKQGMFLTEKAIDGYTVSFHVMKAQAGQQMGGNHSFMIKVEKDGQVQQNLVANTKIVYPDKTAASKMMMKMGDWYMAGYDMDQNGQYQLMVLFKTPDGNKHFGGVYYTASDGQAR